MQLFCPNKTHFFLTKSEKNNDNFRNTYCTIIQVELISNIKFKTSLKGILNSIYNYNVQRFVSCGNETNGEIIIMPDHFKSFNLFF